MGQRQESECVGYKVEMNQVSVLSSFLFAAVMDVVTELAKEGVLSELLYTVYLVLIDKTIEGLSNKFRELKEAFENKDLKVNLGKTNVNSVEALQGMVQLKVKLNNVASAA